MKHAHKRARWWSYICPTCGAAAGAICRKLTFFGYQRMTNPHKARREAAK